MNKSQGWIVVRNWDRFQHPDARRGEGIQPWFKVYTKLAHNPDFDNLTMPQKGLLLSIWVNFAASDGLLSVSRMASEIAQIPGQRMRRDSLDSLIQAGFIMVVASRPLASSKQRASLDKRREEKNPPNPPSSETATPNGKVYRCDHCPGGMTFKSQARLDEHIHNVHDLEHA